MKSNKPLPVFILHGWTKDTQKWNQLVGLLKQAGFAPKLLKIPGLTAPIKKPWTLKNYIDWFEQITEEHKHFFVIAHSFGGRIAIGFDVTHPDRIKKLILIDSAGIRPASLAAVLKRASFKAVAKLGRKLTKRQSARKLLYKLAGEKDYYKADKILAQTMANIIEIDQKKDLVFVKAHTLIIWGNSDKTTPLSDGRTMNKTIIGSSLKIIDGARHSPQYTHPDQVASLIVNFLKSGK